MNLFDISRLETELSHLEEQTMKENFWNDNNNSSKILTKIKQLKTKCNKYKKLKNEITNLRELTELLQLEPDEEMAKEILKNTKKTEKDLEKLELETLLSR